MNSCKECNSCNETKKLEDFPKQARGLYGRRAVCKMCFNKYRKAYYESHKDVILQQQAISRAKPEKKEYQREYHAKWRIANAEHEKERVAAWCKANPDRTQANNQKRRARVKGVFIEHIDRLALAERDGWICGICMGTVDRSNWSVDHVIPVSKGGEHAWYNVQIAHKRCNSSKHDRIVPTRPAFLTASVKPWPPAQWEPGAFEEAPLEEGCDVEAFLRDQEELLSVI